MILCCVAKWLAELEDMLSSSFIDVPVTPVAVKIKLSTKLPPLAVLFLVLIWIASPSLVFSMCKSLLTSFNKCVKFKATVPPATCKVPEISGLLTNPICIPSLPLITVFISFCVF